MKKRLFVDMDGTLAVFHPLIRIETPYQEGYFLNLEPMGAVLSAVKRIAVQNSNIDVFVLSAYLSDSRYITRKIEWQGVTQGRIKRLLFQFHCSCIISKKHHIGSICHEIYVDTQNNSCFTNRVG